jgi:hypothetical protein
MVALMAERKKEKGWVMMSQVWTLIPKSVKIEEGKPRRDSFEDEKVTWMESSQRTMRRRRQQSIGGVRRGG